MDGTVDSNGVIVFTIGRPFNQSFRVIYFHSWRELMIMALVTLGTLINHSCLSDIIFPFLTPCQLPGSDSCDVTDILSVGMRLEIQLPDMVKVIFLSHNKEYGEFEYQFCRRQLKRRNFGNSAVDKNACCLGDPLKARVAK